MAAPTLSGLGPAPHATASVARHRPQSHAHHNAQSQSRTQSQHKSQAQAVTAAVTVTAGLNRPASSPQAQRTGVPTRWSLRCLSFSPKRGGKGENAVGGGRGRRGWAVCAVAPPSVPAEKLSEPELATWQASVVLLTSALGLGEEDADVALRKAFGWRDRSYWRDEIVDQVPDPNTLSEILSFLKEACGMEAKDVAALLKEFPQVLACSLDKRLRPNVEYLDKKWRISGSSLKGVLLRNPLLLGYTVDCSGDCIAECDYCWARF